MCWRYIGGEPQILVKAVQFSAMRPAVQAPHDETVDDGAKLKQNAFWQLAQGPKLV
jgi:hypothetical protein